MKITERQGEILDRIIEEYIESAQPVSSQLLERRYSFDICPATIRIEMQKLTEKGLLYQPYTSSGRIPTDRGYRFFVDELLERELKEEEEIEDWFEGGIEDEIRFIQLLTKNLAVSSQSLAISYLEKEKIFWKEGWEEILKEPEFREKDCVTGLIRLLTNLEENIESLKLNSGIKIYIGKENPFKNARDFSIISSRCHLPNSEEGILSLIGLKRMDYDRNISLINSLTKLMENF